MNDEETKKLEDILMREDPEHNFEARGKYHYKLDEYQKAEAHRQKIIGQIKSLLDEAYYTKNSETYLEIKLVDTELIGSALKVIEEQQIKLAQIQEEINLNADKIGMERKQFTNR